MFSEDLERRAKRPVETVEERLALPLRDFMPGNKHPSVFLIWREPQGARDLRDLVCIHSSQELGDRRVRGLNSNRFWAGVDNSIPARYFMEAMEIDHLRASVEYGYDMGNEQELSRIVAQSMASYLDTRRYEHLRRRSAERISDLEQQLSQAQERIRELEQKLAEVS